MKYTPLCVVLCCLSTLAFAQSTCEERVDAHPNVSTNERIAYCLAPSPSVDTETHSGLIFSGVSPVAVPQKSSSKPTPTAHSSYFKNKKKGVSNRFVETTRFPQFVNSQVSLQEQRVQQVAYPAADTLVVRQASFSPSCQRGQGTCQSVPLKISKETVAGLKARQAKPGRRLLVVQTQEVEKTVSEPSVEGVSAEVPVVVDPTSYSYEAYAPSPVEPSSGGSPVPVYEPVPLTEYAPAEVESVAVPGIEGSEK